MHIQFSKNLEVDFPFLLGHFIGFSAGKKFKNFGHEKSPQRGLISRVAAVGVHPAVVLPTWKLVVTNFHVPRLGARVALPAVLRAVHESEVSSPICFGGLFPQNFP